MVKCFLSIPLRPPTIPALRSAMTRLRLRYEALSEMVRRQKAVQCVILNARHSIGKIDEAFAPRSGQLSPYPIATRMSGMPSCAIMLPSRKDTAECSIDVGLITTSISR